MNYKKGAMFGLDARIALAIFGALSVISGAALYSAIQNAKAEQWRQVFVEIIKATEQYYLDNGKQLSPFDSHYIPLYINDLSENRESLTTWRGPYLNYEVSHTISLVNDFVKTIHTNASIAAYLRVGSDWTEANYMNTDGLCVMNDSDCYEWIALVGGSSDAEDNIENLFMLLDKLVDNSDGVLKGKVRLNREGSGYLMFKGIPHKRTVY